MESENINLTLPIKIPYEVLQQLTDRSLIGMEIGTGKRKQRKTKGYWYEVYQTFLDHRDQLLIKFALDRWRVDDLPSEIQMYTLRDR